MVGMTICNECIYKRKLENSQACMYVTLETCNQVLFCRCRISKVQPGTTICVCTINGNDLKAVV